MPPVRPPARNREPCTKSAPATIGSSRRGISSGASLLLPAMTTMTSKPRSLAQTNPARNAAPTPMVEPIASTVAPPARATSGERSFEPSSTTRTSSTICRGARRTTSPIFTSSSRTGAMRTTLRPLYMPAWSTSWLSQRAPQRRHHALLLVSCDLGKHRQRQDLARRLLGDREGPLAESQSAKRALKMKRDRIVNLGADTVGVQLADDLVAVGHAYDVQMKDVLVAGQRARRRHRRQVGQELVVAPGGRAAGVVPARQPLQFRVQHHRLQRVQARIEPQLRVVVLHLAAVIAQRPELGGQLVGVGGHRARVAVSAEILPRVEAGARGQPAGPRGAAVPPRPLRLGGVLDDR